MTGNLHLLDHNVDASKCPPIIIANGSKVSIEKKRAPKYYLLPSQMFLFANVNF
jgi:hypothetical protein